MPSPEDEQPMNGLLAALPADVREAFVQKLTPVPLPMRAEVAA